LVAPITLGGTTIGDLQLHGVDPGKEWSESELALIRAVVDQVAQTAENLRLLDETQERASREQLVGQISDRLRRAPDVETLMKVAVSELSRVLDPARTFVRLGPDVKLDLPQGEASAEAEPLPTEGQDQIETDPELRAEAGVVEPIQEESPADVQPLGVEVTTPVEDAAANSTQDVAETAEDGLDQAEEITPRPVHD
jgi:GAF domain-containing protein